ncbi:hypothetical protein GCM10010440_71360 [Kitasatospora cinereorecta]
MMIQGAAEVAAILQHSATSPEVRLLTVLAVTTKTVNTIDHTLRKVPDMLTPLRGAIEAVANFIRWVKTRWNRH